MNQGQYDDIQITNGFLLIFRDTKKPEVNNHVNLIFHQEGLKCKNNLIEKLVPC